MAVHQGETITFPLDEALPGDLTEREREQIAEIIEDAGQMIERDDGILVVLGGLKALGWERRGLTLREAGAEFQRRLRNTPDSSLRLEMNNLALWLEQGEMPT